MVYKKYIKKNGKFYGPYNYHSRRVNGKVVSDYHGKKNFLHKKIFFFFGGFLLFLSLIYFSVMLINNSGNLTGKFTFDFEANYVENGSLEGVLKFSLKKGELLPTDSGIVLETDSGKIYEYTLKDFVSSDSTKGNFYVEGRSLSGVGDGYGVSGKGEVSKPINFVLVLSKEIDSKNEKTGEENEKNETIVAEENIGGENSSETLEENSNTEKSEEKSEEKLKEENIIEENSNTEKSEEKLKEANVYLITGGTIFGSFLNFFQGLTLTGNVVLEIEDEIEGVASLDSPFVYELSEGQTASIKEGSVFSGDESLSPEILNLKVEDGKIIVSTDYVSVEEGFGKEFLEDAGAVIILNLSEFEILSEEGKLKISLVYQGEEIISADTLIKRGVTSNVTVVLNETQNVTLNTTETQLIEWVLTEEEKEILLEEFGNVSIKTTKAEIVNNRIVLRHEIGDYWIEYSYNAKDVLELNQNELEKDKIKWLKDLAKKISTNKRLNVENEKLEGLLGNSTSLNEFTTGKLNDSSNEENSLEENVSEIGLNESIS